MRRAVSIVCVLASVLLAAPALGSILIDAWITNPLPPRPQIALDEQVKINHLVTFGPGDLAPGTWYITYRGNLWQANDQRGLVDEYGTGPYDGVPDDFTQTEWNGFSDVSIEVMGPPGGPAQFEAVRYMTPTVTGLTWTNGLTRVYFQEPGVPALPYMIGQDIDAYIFDVVP